MRVIIKVCLVLFVIGLTTAVISIFMGLDIEALRTFLNEDDLYEEKTYVVTNEFDLLDIHVDRRHIHYKVTDDSFYTISYYEKEDETWTFTTNDRIFTIEQSEKQGIRHWFNYKYVSKEIITMTIEVPRSALLELSLSTNVGEIRLEFDEFYTLNQIDLSSQTGSIYMSYIEAPSLRINVNTGNIRLSDIKIDGNINITSDTGNALLSDIEAKELKVVSDTGSVNVSNALCDQLEIKVDTGRILISDTQVESSIKATTQTGAINLTHAHASSYDLKSQTGTVTLTFTNLNDFYYNLRTQTGTITIEGDSKSKTYQTTAGDVLIKVDVQTGDIRIQS